MATFYIIGINLKLRTGIHLGTACQKQVVVGLIGVGTLSIRGNQDSTGKSSGAGIVHYTFEQLIAFTNRYCMMNKGIVVNMLVLINQIQTVEEVLSMTSDKPSNQVVKGNTCTERAVACIKRRLAFLVEVITSNLHGSVMLILQIIEIQNTCFTNKTFRHGIDNKTVGRPCMITKQHFNLRIFRYIDKVTLVNHNIFF